MSTPRSESIKLSFSDTTEPIRESVESGFDGQKKIDHYAYMGRFIRSGMDFFFGDDSTYARISTATSDDELNCAFSDSLFESMKQVFSDPSSHDTVDTLREFEGSSGKYHHSPIEASLKGGIGTYMQAVDSVYTALYLSFGTDIAQHPDNAIILDHISKLNIDFLGPYADIFLNDSLYNTAPQNLAGFIDQLEPSGSGGLKFKPGFPASALLPNGSIKNHTTRIFDDFVLHGDETLQLKDVPTHSVTVGCPFSFEPKDGRRLWSLYASARATVRQRKQTDEVTLASTDDTLESDLKMP